MNLSPSVTTKLRGYQHEPVIALSGGFSRHNSMIDTSQMGLGKSFVAIATAITTGLRPIILCRVAAKANWARYLRHFDIDPASCTITNLEALKGGRKPLGEWQDGKTARGREYKKFVWSVPEDSLMVFDEVHGCSGIDSKAGKMLVSAAFQHIPSLLVSATAADSPLKMRAIGFHLGLHRVSDFYPWLLAHGCEMGSFGPEFTCGMRPGQYLVKVKGEWEKIPEGWAEMLRRRREVMAKIHRDIFPERGVRLRQCDVPGFPKNTIIPEAIDFQSATPEIVRAYRQLNEDLKLLKTKFEAGPLLKKTQQKIEMLKLPVIAQAAKEAIEEGYSVVIFTNFNESLDEMMRLMKTDCVIRGSQPADVRARNEERFQTNQSPIILANNQAGGESVNFHDLEGGHPRQTWIFPTFWAIALRQCAGRAPRNGGKTPVVQRIPYAAGTVEEDALNSTEAKLNQVDAFNGDPLAGLTDEDLTAGLPI